MQGIFIRDHARAAAMNHEVVVLYASPISEKNASPSVSECVDNGIRTIRLHYPHVRSQESVRSLFTVTNSLISSAAGIRNQFSHCRTVSETVRRLEREGWRPDLIHVHVYSAGLPAVFLNRKLKIPFIITEHWSGFPRRLLSASGKIKARWIMNRAKMILPVSENLREHIKAHGIKNRFEVIPNPVDCAMFHPAEKKANDGSEKKRILVVAGLDPIKGIHHLLDAFALIAPKRDDLILEIVGDGSERGKLEDQVRSLQLEKRVEFGGRLPKEEVAERMRQSDFLVLPSLWENCPCVLIEAMASGLPVIATDVGGVREIVNENSGVVIPPADVTALANTIEDMLNGTHHFDMGQIVRTAREKCSLESVARRLDAIYRELVP